MQAYEPIGVLTININKRIGPSVQFHARKQVIHHLFSFQDATRYHQKGLLRAMDKNTLLGKQDSTGINFPIYYKLNERHLII